MRLWVWRRGAAWLLMLECDADDAPIEFVAGAELVPVGAVLVGVEQEHDEVEPGQGVCDLAVERRGEDAGPSRVGVNASRGIGECPSQVSDGLSGDLSQQVEVWGPVTVASAKDPEQVFVGQGLARARRRMKESLPSPRRGRTWMGRRVSRGGCDCCPLVEWSLADQPVVGGDVVLYFLPPLKRCLTAGGGAVAAGAGPAWVGGGAAATAADRGSLLGEVGLPLEDGRSGRLEACPVATAR